MYGWTPTVKMLLAAGADVNALTITHRNPLMYAGESMREMDSEVT
jgi:hypothetical protein